MAGRTVVVRTIDIGGDKPLPYLDMPHEAIPSLASARCACACAGPICSPPSCGALRAAVHATCGSCCRWLRRSTTCAGPRAASGRVRVARRRGRRASRRRSARDYDETPAAAVTADLLAREADFFSVGSNDLTQYAMAADRGQADLRRATRTTRRRCCG